MLLPPTARALVATASVAVLLGTVVGGCSGSDEAAAPSTSVRTTEVGPVPGATVGTTPLTTPEDEPVPELAVPIVDAEVAVDVLVAAVDDAFDPEEPDWGLPAAWREVGPGLIFLGAAAVADGETISGVEVVVGRDGDEAMAVAVADEDGGCATFVVVVEGSRARAEYGPDPDECSGAAALLAWEDLQDADGSA